jgi:uncharacterized protein YjbI with pentapeptide repeats
MRMRRLTPSLACLLVLLLAIQAQGADLTRQQVQDLLAQAPAGHVANLSGKSLEKLDLSGLDFTHVNLAGANLFGAKLVGCNFTDANLAGASLDLAWVIRADFTRANLAQASLQGLVVSKGLETSADQAPRFTGANLAGARIIARLNWSDARGANFAGASMGADMKNQSMGLMRVDLSTAHLEGANFADADLGRALLRFARLQSANLTGANLLRADLRGAYLNGADLTGALVDGANFDGATLTGARGLDKMQGTPMNLVMP